MNILNPKCPICGSENKTGLIEERDSNLFACGNCRHTFTVPAHAAESEYIDSYFSESHKNWFANPDYRLFRFIYKKLAGIYREKPFSLLDVGCGKGDFLKYMVKKNIPCELSGVDLLENTSPGIKFINADFLSLDLTKKFDVVICLHVIEHFEDPTVFMKKIGSILEKGGLLFIATIDNESLIYEIARFLNVIKSRQAYRRLYYSHHLQHFSHLSLKKLLNLQGYTELEHMGYNYPLKSLDIPGRNFLEKKFHFFFVLCIFILSSIFRRRIAQVILAQKG